MGVVKEVNIKITGQVPGDWQDNDYEVLVAELRVVAARYNLTIEEA